MSTPSASRRYVLVPTTGGARESEASLRRYKLARQRIATMRQDAGGPYAHLKRSHD